MNLRELRINKGMTQATLIQGETWGKALSALENGKRQQIDIELVAKVATRLSTSPGVVFEAILASRQALLAGAPPAVHYYRRPAALAKP